MLFNIVAVTLRAGFRCDNCQKQQSGDISRVHRMLSEPSERLLSEFAFRHGIVGVRFLTVMFSILYKAEIETCFLNDVTPFLCEFSKR